jgi:cyclic beta-1,2-glucan synthetase
MRLISDVDWTELFERLSLADSVLGAHAGYCEMDFPTRSLYRSAVEELARGSPHTELEIARSAVQAARRAGSACVDGGAEQDRRGDLGYHLIAGGRRALEAEVGYRPPLRNRLGRLNRALGLRGYLGAIAAVAAVMLSGALFSVAAAGLGAAWLVLLGALGAIPAVDAAVALVNRVLTKRLGATRPRSSSRRGFPSACARWSPCR